MLLVWVREAGVSVVLTYDCSVDGEGSTVWTGDDFDCPNTNDSIILRHTAEYNTTCGTCNNGSITGRGVSVVDGYYSSLLIIPYTVSRLNETTVTCTYNNGSTEVEIGTIYTLYVLEKNNQGMSLLHAQWPEY